MILDNLDQAQHYAGLPAGFGQAFAYLKQFVGTTADGQYAIDGERVYALVQRYTTTPATKGMFEAHRHYADVHFVLAGRETILWAPLATVEKTVVRDYAEADDAALYALVDTASTLRLSPGQFAVFWPTDAHVPCCDWDGPGQVTKVVVKIRVD